MYICIYKKTKFSTSTGEHILQNSLGPRWTSKSIVCNEAQEEFGKEIDVEIAKVFEPMRSLLNVKTGRGTAPPSLKKVKTESGLEYHLKPSGIAKLAEPVVDFVSRDADTRELRIQLGDRSQVGWAVNKVKEKNPGIDIDYENLKKNLENKTPEESYLNEALIISTAIGGKLFFRGILKAVFNLLGVNNTAIALRSEFDPLRNFILNGTGPMAEEKCQLFSPAASHVNVPKLGRFSHFICVFGRRSKVTAYVRIFGSFEFLFLLTDEYKGKNFQYSYLVNPLGSGEESEERNAHFVVGKIPKPNLSITGEHISKIVVEMYRAFMAKYNDVYVIEPLRKEMIYLIYEEYEKLPESMKNKKSLQAIMEKIFIEYEKRIPFLKSDATA